MSLQLDRYLSARASGAPVELACEQSGIGRDEAELWEREIESGEVELPHARVRTREGDQSTKEETMVSGTVSGDELRLLIERIERLHEERKSIADDIKDVFQEAKSQGFDTHAMRCVMKLRKMEPHKRDEAEAIVATYIEALGMTPIEHAIAMAA